VFADFELILQKQKFDGVIMCRRIEWSLELGAMDSGGTPSYPRQCRHAEVIAAEAA
jgi:hypothetical protein